MPKYAVFVDDNFHQGDVSERFLLGEYSTREEALKICKSRVNEYFEQIEKGKYTFRELWEGYMLYGEDPFIDPDDGETRFSAWDYARQKCLDYVA